MCSSDLLQRIFSQGRPYFSIKKLDISANICLEEVWSKYSFMSIKELKNFVKNTVLYNDLYTEGKNNIFNVIDFLDKFRQQYSVMGMDTKKMLFSQNGPVLVSKWNPRKVNETSLKEL